MKKAIDGLLGSLSDRDSKNNGIFEDILAENLESVSRIGYFYSLPLSNIYSIVKKSKMQNFKILIDVILGLYESGHKNIPVLLEYLDLPELKLEECINIISSFKSSPICVRTGRLYEEYSIRPEIDWEFSLSEKEKEISELKSEIEAKQKEITKYYKIKEENQIKMTNLNSKIKDMQSEITKLIKSNEENQKEIVNLSNKITEEKKEITTTKLLTKKDDQLEYPNLNSKITDIKNEITKLQKNIEENQEEVAKLTSQIKDNQNKVKMMEDTLLQLHKSSTKMFKYDENNKTTDIKNEIAKLEKQKENEKNEEEVTKLVNQKWDNIDKLRNLQFSGIIKYLSSQCGGNVVDNGIVRVEVSSTFCHDTCDLSPKNVFVGGTISSWQSNNVPNQWIKFDFIDKKILLEAYSIYPAYLRSFKLGCSNDGTNWVQIDTRNDVQAFNGNYKSETFTVSPNTPFRFFRFSQTDKTWNNNDYFCIIQIELFGSLIQ